MGIYDRDYMGDNSSASRFDPTSKMLGMLFLGVLLVLAVRFPLPIYLKLPVLIVLAYLLYRLFNS